jgi:hypothetical protein
MNFVNSRSLLPSTSVKLSVRHVITVVKRWRAGGASVRHRSVTMGCHVGCHVKPAVGTSAAEVPMLRPNVNRWSKPRKNFTYQASPLASASCVNTGSLSMKALRGIAKYSSRQNHAPPERFRNRSASRQNSRSLSRDAP